MRKDFILVSLLSYVVLGLIVVKAVNVIYKPGYVCALSPYPLSKLVLAGIVVGVIYTLIGILAYKRSMKWRNSMLTLVGISLVKGNILMLFILSLLAGLLEEAYTRLFILLIINHIELWKMLILILFVNLFWTLIHLIKPDFSFKDLAENIYKTKEHLFMIFLSGIPWFIVTIYYKSIIPAIIAHFLLDFLMGIYVRRNIN